jgi:hypothetical protein
MANRTATCAKAQTLSSAQVGSSAAISAGSGTTAKLLQIAKDGGKASAFAFLRRKLIQQLGQSKTFKKSNEIRIRRIEKR